MMKKLVVMTTTAFLLFGCTPPPQSAPPAVTSQSALKPAVDQGPNWSRAERAAFYSVDQGSRIMPLRWFAALKQPNGDGFLADGLARYGYLKNEEAPASLLPAGFTTNGELGKESVGMTCAACHTRQIQVRDATYRIDGGPAFADFQSFMLDLDQAVGHVLRDDAAFTSFARAVLEGTPNAGQLQELRLQVQEWYKPYHTIVSLALPAKRWGPARLDAVGMIFNRLTGLDIGPNPDHIISDNIKPADAPVRYPFLWNAARQDKTQWPGFADNGDALLGLARNTGEVIGVFADFHPYKDPARFLLKVNYTDANSARTEGLMQLEDLIARIGPPRWQFAYDETLRQQGETIFNWPTNQGGCVECHGVKDGQSRLFESERTWSTRVIDVGTDNREWKMIGVPGRADFPGWSVDPGVLQGASVLNLIPALKPADSPFNVLKISVIGTLIQRLPDIDRFAMEADRGLPPLAPTGQANRVNPQGPRANELSGSFVKSGKAASAPFQYEARVLQGIWAAAPYLHNGSVPTLADLLNPQSQRPPSFKVGPAFDPDSVGLAREQPGASFTYVTTGCEDRSSGTSNCGHEFGTSLTPDQKKALLEYLKML